MLKACKKSAKTIIDNVDDFEKSLDDLVRREERDRVRKIEILDEVKKIAGDNIIGKGLYGGKILSKADLEKWAKYLKENYGTNLEKVDDFDNPNILAQFDSNTNTIRYKDDVTEYFMAHESFHAEEMKKLGFDEYVKDAPLKGVKESDYTAENLIRRYKREKYVYDKLKQNASKYSLNG